MDVRSATEADLPAILAIYNHCVLHSTCTADYQPQTLEQRREWFELRVRANLPVLVAVGEAGQIAGWAALNPYHVRPGYRFSVENSVYIHHEQRARGIGRLLLERLIADARALGYHTIIAGIDSENHASLRLHERLGFHHVAHLSQVIYKFERWLDVIYMQLLL
jgi:phosphinothricin acetyltransferase